MHKKEIARHPEVVGKTLMVVGLLGLLGILGRQYVLANGETDLVAERRSMAVLSVPTRQPTQVELLLPTLVPESTTEIVIGQVGEDIAVWEDISRQTSDFEVDLAPNRELIRYLFLFKELVQEYTRERVDLAENPFTQGQEFREYLENNLSEAGYASLLATRESQVAMSYLERYYKNLYVEDKDGFREPVQCMGAQILAASTKGIFYGAPVSVTSHPGSALNLAAKMVNQADGAEAPNIANGMVVRMPKDKFEMDLVLPGDTIALRYGDLGGHVLIVLGKGHSQTGQEMVLIFDANHLVDDQTKITNGLPLLRWMTSEQFASQYETMSSQTVGIRSKNP